MRYVLGVKLDDITTADGFESLFDILRDVPDVIGEVYPEWDFKDEEDNKNRAVAILEAQEKIPATRKMMAAQITSVKKMMTGTKNGQFINQVILDGALTTYAKMAYNSKPKMTTSHAKRERQDIVLNECAAYFVACLMGARYARLIPPLILKKFDWKLCALQAQAPGVDVRKGGKVSTVSDDVVCAAALFDSVILNSDRANNNYLVDGKRAYLIDHELCFGAWQGRPNSDFVSERKRRKLSPLTTQEEDSLNKLLASHNILEALLSEGQAQRVRDAIQQILKRGSV